MTDLAAIRLAYARKMQEIAGVSSPRIAAAYAAVPREDFVGKGPWTLFDASGYRPAGNTDPAQLYQDVLVALLPEKRINNGQPSGHFAWLAAAGPRPGDHAVHIGAGTGYYTAILAELVGPGGRVTAIEYDAGLAGRAARNLSRYPNVTVIHGDGVTCPFDPANVVYVNAGAPRPADNWLERLKPGGRLVMPLTAIDTNIGGAAGGMFRFERDGDEYAVSLVSPAAFIRCEGLADEQTSAALAAALRSGGADQANRLVRGHDWPEDRTWLRWPGWSLLMEPPQT